MRSGLTVGAVHLRQWFSPLLKLPPPLEYSSSCHGDLHRIISLLLYHCNVTQSGFRTWKLCVPPLSLSSHLFFFPQICDFCALLVGRSPLPAKWNQGLSAPVPAIADSVRGDNSIMSGLQAPHILPLLPLVRGKPRQDESHIPSCPCLPRKRNLKPVAAEWNQIPQGRGGDVRSLVVWERGAKPGAPRAGKTSADMQIMPSSIPALWGPWKVELRICQDLWSAQCSCIARGSRFSPQFPGSNQAWLPRLPGGE